MVGADDQGDSSSRETSTNNSLLVREPSVALGSSSEVVFVRDVFSSSICGTEDSQALIVRSQGHTPEMVHRLPTLSPSYYLSGTENNIAQQEQLHQLQQQTQHTQQRMEEVVGRMQQTAQQTHHTQQQLQDQIDTIQQTLQQMERQRIKDAQGMTQQLALNKQQLEKVQKDSEQRLQQQIGMIQQRIQQLDQGIHNLQQMDQQIPQNHPLPEQRSQETLQFFEHIVHTQHHVQAILAKPFQELQSLDFLSSFRNQQSCILVKEDHVHNNFGCTFYASVVAIP